MKARNTQKARKKATNLTLSDDSLRYAAALKIPLNRGSITSVIESLILDKARRLGIKDSNGKALQFS